MGKKKDENQIQLDMGNAIEDKKSKLAKKEKLIEEIKKEKKNKKEDNNSKNENGDELTEAEKVKNIVKKAKENHE